MNIIFKKIEQLKKNILSKVASCLINIKKKVLELKNEKPDVDINSLTSRLIEEELKRENYKFKYFKVLNSTVYVIITIAACATILTTFFMPVLQINSSSMAPNFNSGDYVVSYKTKKIKQGDVIAFYYGNKILVKRVIAEAGEWVSIDVDGNVYVNGKVLEETYISEKTLGKYDIEFPYQVPADAYFVLSDNRDDVTDSRIADIGCISIEQIIGKVKFKLWAVKK